MVKEKLDSVSRSKKILAFTGLLVGLTLLGGTAILVQSVFLGQEPLEASKSGGSFDRGAIESDTASYSKDVPESPEFEIAKGDIRVESDDAETDSVNFRTLVGNYSGEIDSEDISETERYLTYSFKAKIPSKDLDNFVQEMKGMYEVEEVSIDRETVEAEREVNRKKVLLESMEVYNQMLEKVRSSEELTTEEIRVVSRLTDEKARIANQLNRLGYSLEELEEQEKMSRLSVTFREEVNVEILPEDIAQEVREELSSAMNSIVEQGSKLLAVPVELVSWLFIGLRYALISVALLVPFAVLLKIGEKLWKKL